MKEKDCPGRLKRTQRAATQVASGRRLFSEADLEVLYATGYAKYEAMEYRSALEYFIAGAVHNPFDVRFQMSAGACLSELGEFDRAVAHFAVAGALDPDSIQAMLFASECLIKSGNNAGAHAGLTMLLEQTGRTGTHAIAHSRAAELMRIHFPGKSGSGASDDSTASNAATASGGSPPPPKALRT